MRASRPLTAPAPRGHAQVPDEILVKVDRAIVANPLATLREVAQETRVSRDTVQRRRKKLEAAGALPRLNRRALGLARNRARFASPNFERARPRRRQAECSLVIKVVIGDDDWSRSYPVRFLGPVVVNEETEGELIKLLEHHVRTTVLPHLQKDWPLIEEMRRRS